MKAGPAWGVNTTTTPPPDRAYVIPSRFNRRKRGRREAGSRAQIGPCCRGVSERPPKENVPDGKMGFRSGGEGNGSNRGDACGAPAGSQDEGASSAEHLHECLRRKFTETQHFPPPCGCQQPVAMTTHTASRAQRKRKGAGVHVCNERPRCTSERTAVEGNRSRGSAQC